MQRTSFVAYFAALAGCGWFEKDTCNQGAERCHGQLVLTCAAVGTGATGDERAWIKTRSCALLGEGLVCRAHDGVAACVRPSVDGSVPGSPANGQPAFADPPPTAPAAWSRFAVHRGDRGLVSLALDHRATLTFAPASPAQGHLAAVALGSDDRARAAVLVDMNHPAGSFWLPIDGVTRVRLVRSKGEVAAELAVQAASLNGAAATQAALTQAAEEVPPTLRVVRGGREVSGTVDGLPRSVRTVEPTPEMLSLVAGALQRLPAFAVSIVTDLAFIGNGGVLGPTGPSVRILGATLVIGSSDPAALRARPEALARDVVREVALQFVRTTSASTNVLSPDPFAFPQDFPPEIATLLKQRVSPLLALFENFRDAWAALHGIAVEGGLARPYGDLEAVADNAAAIAAGFATARGACGPSDDFAEYVASAAVPELWQPSPCGELRAAPLDQLAPKLLVHLAKLEALWGLGMLRGDQLEACVGRLPLAKDASGIVARRATGEHITFRHNVSGSVEPYYHGQTQVALTAEDLASGNDATTAAFTLSARGTPRGLYRLTSVGKRADAEVGAGFYLSKPSTYERSEAGGGLLLITRLDATRIEAHALMVRQGAKSPFFRSPVFPLIIARYDLPEDERGELHD